jgi:hypothetical protein
MAISASSPNSYKKKQKYLRVNFREALIWEKYYGVK